MNPFPIGNLHNPPLNNVNGELVNIDNSHVGSFSFSNKIIPDGQYTMPPPGNNIQSAAGILPNYQNGGKMKRKKNKISRKYKMKRSNGTIRRRIKRRVRSKYHRRSSKRRSRRSKKMKGGAFQPPMTTPNYPAGYSQYLNNNGSISNTYGLGGHLSANDSALANPPMLNKLLNASIPDNLNHNTLNSYGNIGAGSGFPSRG